MTHLERYGMHDLGCDTQDRSDPTSMPCTCGLVQALEQEKSNATKAQIRDLSLLHRIETIEHEAKKILAWWEDTEARAADAHAVYQEEAHRRGDVRHPDAYADLSEATKEWDRVLVRWVARTLRAAMEGKS